MNPIIAKFLAWLDRREDNRRLNQMAAHWHRMGAVSPYSAAEEERFLRLKLEEFRNYASKRWMDDHTVDRETIKSEWLARVVAPMAGVPECRDAAKCLKAAIMVCGEEMFAGEAKRERRKFMDEKVREAQRLSPANKNDMRHRALKK